MMMAILDSKEKNVVTISAVTWPHRLKRLMRHYLPASVGPAGDCRANRHPIENRGQHNRAD